MLIQPTLFYYSFRKSARKVGGGLIKAIQSTITTFYSYVAYQFRVDDLLL